ncbi:MAG: alpha/beta hydrolase [Desulfobacterales bacterium]|nr:alpha/beta hydrolase [Desulfobacterales bacterium]
MKQHLARQSIFRPIAVFFTASAILFSGCAYFANKPLKTLSYVAGTPSPNRNLFIFLRGLGGSHHSFEKEGLVEATRQRGLDFDMAAPNAHFIYYLERTLLQRLRQDVILPAKGKGYENIWLVGFSMGGLGSLLYAHKHPEDIKGVCLISPFLGYDALIDEINKSGGLQNWTPGEYSPDDDWQRMLWHWIKTRVASQNAPPVYLGFGTGDPYAQAQQLLATALPAHRVIRLKGAHDYETFKKIWQRFLDRNVWRDNEKTRPAAPD